MSRSGSRTQDQTVAANLAVWYQTQGRQGAAAPSGCRTCASGGAAAAASLTLPVDGVSGATRPAGEHALRFDGKQGAIAKLPPGKYTLVVEAAREVGGRELLKIPFTWPANSAATPSRRRASTSSAPSPSRSNPEPAAPPLPFRYDRWSSR